jgi:hypothetical protein
VAVLSHTPLREVLSMIGNEPLTDNERLVASSVYGQLRELCPEAKFWVRGLADREMFHLYVCRRYGEKAEGGRSFHTARTNEYGDNGLELEVLIGDAVAAGLLL